jgi:hypothetical protein
MAKTCPQELFSVPAGTMALTCPGMIEASRMDHLKVEANQ